MYIDRLLASTLLNGTRIPTSKRKTLMKLLNLAENKVLRGPENSK
jgi:hypothetical protein